MDQLNAEIQNDVARIRSELASPADRRYCVMAKRDHIRVKYDRDAGDLCAYSEVLDRLDELGYKHSGTNFGGRVSVYEPRDA